MAKPQLPVLVKLRAVLGQLAALRTSDFPYADGLEALQVLEETFRSDLQQVEDTEGVDEAVLLEANANIVRLHPILGFILRSTNIRNSFEAYDPLLRMARSLLGKRVRLIFSSEWLFSPYTYAPAFRELPHFVFIGLPAMEASNALILPLAGHELGHAVWSQNNLLDSLEQDMLATLRAIYQSSKFFAKKGRPASSLMQWDMQDIANLEAASTWLERQTEEIFCDCVGVRLFGAGFLHSFHYLISPSLGLGRSSDYPSISQRVSFLEKSASHFGHKIPNDFSKSFVALEVDSYFSELDKKILRVVEEANESLFDKVLGLVGRVVPQRVPHPKEVDVQAIMASFSDFVPFNAPADLASVIDAGWRIYNDDSAWPSEEQNHEKRSRVVSELVYKTLEVSEFETRTRRLNAAKQPRNRQAFDSSSP